MKFSTLIILRLLDILAVATTGQADITVYPVTEVNEANKTGYFSDPFHVPFEGGQKIYFSGTTQSYLECNGSLGPKCASKHDNNYTTGETLQRRLGRDTQICSVAGIHPFQSGSGANRSWDAVVTLHVQNTPDYDGIAGWSVIAHAHPAEPSAVEVPPKHWIGDTLLVGSFARPEEANYDGKYFRTPDGQLYLLYSKQQSPKPKHRDGVAAWPLDDARTKAPGSKPTFLLVPDDDLNSEDYHKGDADFKLIETGNMHAINGKFLMAYSVGAFNKDTYKLGVAYSDTFLPRQSPGLPPQYYRKVMKENPDRLWGTVSRPKEAYYLLQADQNHPGWRYVGDQVLAPGVPTVARIGPSHSWVLTFAGYSPGDAPLEPNTTQYMANHRRPFFIDIDVRIPDNISVAEASDVELQSWIVPHQRERGSG